MKKIHMKINFAIRQHDKYLMFTKIAQNGVEEVSADETGSGSSGSV